MCICKEKKVADVALDIVEFPRSISIHNPFVYIERRVRIPRV